jgi:serine phosphatase RsbU (regulator of sigma subunit)
LVVGVIGAAITASVTWVAAALNTHNDHRLLQVQARQAAAVISSTILSIQAPLVTALEIETATHGALPQFRAYMGSETGPGRLFASASVWRVQGRSLHRLATVGAPPDLGPGLPRTQDFISSAVRSPTFVVTNITRGGRQRVGYAIADASDPVFVIYAERAIPSDRQVPAESGSAFSDLNFATYLGGPTTPSDLETTDLPPDRLPITGYTATDVIPFGNAKLTLVASARGQLGGTLGAQLPWVFLVAGGVLTVATAMATLELVRRRLDAERKAAVIAGLYSQLDDLYGQQRTIAETLQRALLPQGNPHIPELEVATRYVAGAKGVDIGGDWYSCVAIDERRFAFVVGDVSGRGVGAAAIMARLRFTLRAYLIEGHGPDVALSMCSRQIEINSDGHFATALVGVGDLDDHQLTVANAGHLQPLVVSPEGPSWAHVDVGLPLGVGPSSYTTTVVPMPVGATFLAFTDGLVERRGENIEEGLGRLAAAAMAPAATLDELLDSIVARLAHSGTEDDIAVLALRWREPVVPTHIPRAHSSEEVRDN